MKLIKRRLSKVKKGFILTTKIDVKKELKDSIRYNIKIILAINILIIIIGAALASKYEDFSITGFSNILIAVNLFFIFGMGLADVFTYFYYKKIILVGVHEEGIWLHDQLMGRIGFIEWNWIKKIYISPDQERVFFIVHDMKGIKRMVGLKGFLVSFSIFPFFVQRDDERAIQFRLKHFSEDIFNLIAEREFAKLLVIPETLNSNSK